MEVLLLAQTLGFVLRVVEFRYMSYNFVIGAYSYWGPKAGYSIYHMSNADLLFGDITIVCGILGTLSGGLILESMTSTISNAFKLLSGATFLGTIFCMIAICFKSLSGFIVLLSMGELLIFATQDHINNWRKTALILTSVFFLAVGIRFIDGEENSATTRRGKLKPLLEGIWDAAPGDSYEA